MEADDSPFLTNNSQSNNSTNEHSTENHEIPQQSLNDLQNTLDKALQKCQRKTADILVVSSNGKQTPINLKNGISIIKKKKFIPYGSKASHEEEVFDDNDDNCFSPIQKPNQNDSENGNSSFIDRSIELVNRDLELSNNDFENLNSNLSTNKSEKPNLPNNHSDISNENLNSNDQNENKSFDGSMNNSELSIALRERMSALDELLDKMESQLEEFDNSLMNDEQ